MLQGAAFRMLACFYDNDQRSFVELCKRAGYPTDLGGYYLRQLVSGEYVAKNERGLLDRSEWIASLEGSDLVA